MTLRAYKHQEKNKIKSKSDKRNCYPEALRENPHAPRQS